MKQIDGDWLIFLASMGAFILYLVFSAMTEMGTKIPAAWRDRKVTQFKGNKSQVESQTEAD